MAPMLEESMEGGLRFSTRPCVVYKCVYMLQVSSPPHIGLRVGMVACFSLYVPVYGAQCRCSV